MVRRFGCAFAGLLCSRITSTSAKPKSSSGSALNAVAFGVFLESGPFFEKGGENMSDRFRERLEKLAWKHTHRDFKGVCGEHSVWPAGTQTILVNRQGTCLIRLEDATDQELLNKLPTKIQEAFLAEFLEEIRSKARLVPDNVVLEGYRQARKGSQVYEIWLSEISRRDLIAW